MKDIIYIVEDTGSVEPGTVTSKVEGDIDYGKRINTEKDPLSEKQYTKATIENIKPVTKVEL